ncbi:MAG TPA: alpha/beta fold hydrolase [Chthoniobacterales bacterium]|nr:alpha/beta fold hydrolase [Chthoniobacterales bacterium]
MQQKVVFKSRDLNCSGLFYLPDNYSAAEGKKLPAIAMAHGIGTTKEIGLPQYAQRFAGAGFAVLLFDFRNLGESEGTPRAQVFAEEQQEDYRNAITWLQLQPQIDPERIGVWGFSFSGGHVLQVAAFDRRVKCVVAQVPAVSGFLVAQRSNTPLELDGISTMLSKDRRQRYETGEVNYLPLVAPPEQPCFFPSSEEAREFFEAAQVASEGRFENRITFESLERLRYFEPAVRIDAISPTPLRMILAKKDSLVPTDIALAAYARAHEPKSLVFLEGGHLGKSEGDDFETASAAARDWFVQWLKPSNVEAFHRPVVDGIPQISVQELKRKLDAKEDVYVVDVREPHEYNIVNLGHIVDLGMPLIPVGDIERRASELAHKKNSEIVIYCKAGVRSQKAALTLKQAGFTNVLNLTGGILAWAEKIDPSMPKY